MISQKNMTDHDGSNFVAIALATRPVRRGTVKANFALMVTWVRRIDGLLLYGLAAGASQTTGHPLSINGFTIT